MTTRSRRAMADSSRLRFHEPGPNGWDPLSQGKARYSGAIPTRKGVAGSRVAFYTSHAEQIAAVVAEMHPLITAFGRGDLSDDAERLRHVTGPDGPRFPIRYLFAGDPHTYLPDFVGVRAPAGGESNIHPGRSRFVIEAGPLRYKATTRELAKLSTAHDLVRQTGGEVLIVCPEVVPPRWVRNALDLHLR